MTKAEVVILLNNLQKVFDIVRLVDASIMTQYYVNENGELYLEEYKCYAVWNKKQRCENCISAKAFTTKSRVTKYEFINNDIYYVVAKYIEVEEKAFVIEIVSNVTDEVLFGAFGKDRIIHEIQRHNDILYRDPLTHVFNRKYYEEQLHSIHTVKAIAMIDIDNFKSINDTFGHNIGDKALKKVVEAIEPILRNSDSIIRYGGDEFLIVFPNMPKNSFKNTLEEIRESVEKIKLQEYPDVKITISIGGCFSNGTIDEDNIDSADKMLYVAKKRKNSVCCLD